MIANSIWRKKNKTKQNKTKKLIKSGVHRLLTKQITLSSHFCSLPVAAAVRTKVENAITTRRIVDVLWAGHLYIFKSFPLQRDHCRKCIS